MDMDSINILANNNKMDDINNLDTINNMDDKDFTDGMLHTSDVVHMVCNNTCRNVLPDSGFNECESMRLCAGCVIQVTRNVPPLGTCSVSQTKQ